MKPWHPSRIPSMGRGRREGVCPVSPPTLLAGGFALLILLGTLLLKLPLSTDIPVSWMDAFFTATSAVTVTGLSVVDVASHYSFWGELIILLLMQAGGLGLMTFAVVALLMIGGRIGLRQQLVAREAFNQTNLVDVAHTARAVIKLALTLELVGFCLLALAWVPEKGVLEGSWWALFHAVSAFNNAGFMLSADGLQDSVGNPLVTVTITGLFVVGGLGFVVLVNLLKNRRWRSLTVYTRLMLIGTLVLDLVATGMVFLLEYNNPATLGALPGLPDQLLAAWFQGVTPRTAGFNTLDTAALTTPTAVFLLLLMFIGAGPTSTGGGIKLSTFIVLVAATWCFIRRQGLPVIMGRSVSEKTVVKALAVTVMLMGSIFFGVFLLSFTEQQPFLDLTFEVVSAAGTVGLSRGATPELSVFGQLVIMALMFMGRLGPLTVAYLLATPRPSSLRHAEADIQIG